MSWPCLRLPVFLVGGRICTAVRTNVRKYDPNSVDFSSGDLPSWQARRLLGRRGSSMCSRRRREDGFRIMTDIVATERGSRDYVNALARGLEVIRVFTRHQPRMTLSEVARATDMTRATVRRFLLTLAQEGYVGSDGKYYRLTPKVLDLGFSVLSSMDIWESGQPIMNELATALDESCFAAVLDADMVIYVLRASSRR